jgi:hypothetical protein
MKIAARLALCVVVCVQPALAENAANAHLLSLAPEARATILGKTVGEGCVVKTAFYMGIAESGFAKDKVFWSIRCQDNRAFVVEVNPRNYQYLGMRGSKARWRRGVLQKAG